MTTLKHIRAILRNKEQSYLAKPEMIHFPCGFAQPQNSNVAPHLLFFVPIPNYGAQILPKIPRAPPKGKKRTPGNEAGLALIATEIAT